MVTMDDLDLFIKGLGPYAKQYTPEQLKQLHLEARKLSEILLQRYKATMVLKRRQRFPQASLDASKMIVLLNHYWSSVLTDQSRRRLKINECHHLLSGVIERAGRWDKSRVPGISVSRLCEPTE